MTSSRRRVIVAGSINIDIVARVRRHPVAGETVPGISLAYYPGGKGANQAVAAARAGATVAILGAIGDDSFAPQLVAFLDEHHVGTAQLVRLAGMPTGTAIILVDSSGENSVVVVPGANSGLTARHLSSAELRGGDVLVAQLETPSATTEAFFARGAAVGTTCILNPAPADVVPASLLKLVDVLIVNETELGVIAEQALSLAPGIDEIRGAHDALRDNGFRGCLVATLGRRGSITLIGERTIEVPGRDVVAVDTTGAGDCFVGYLAASLSFGHDMDRALGTANAAASLCVQRPGAGPSMPDQDEVLELVECAR
jgi:ribokinase